MAFDNLKFAEDDARIIAEKLKALYEAVRQANGEPGYKLAAGDPERLVQLTEAAVLAQVNHDIDATGKGNLLYYAGEETIEHLGYLYGQRGTRLDASFARTTMRYTLSAERQVVTPIPKGYRITPDNKVFFATLNYVEVPAGQLTIEVEAESQTPGVAGNGFEPGEIKNMVDISPFVATAENITMSTGGAEQESIEAYRERLRMLPESFSVAGPDGAYEFWARSANAGIVDAKAWMPDLDLGAFAEFLEPWGITDVEGFYNELFNYFRTSGTGPGNVNIAVLMKDGELPSEEVRDQVFETLTAKRVRPLTDFVHIKEPEPVEYNIVARYWIRVKDATKAQSIIENVDVAVERFIAWQKNILGRAINPSYLHQMIMECGVKWVEVDEPLPTNLMPWQVGVLGGNPPQVTFEGLEEE